MSERGAGEEPKRSAWRAPYGAHLLAGYSLRPRTPWQGECLILHGGGKAHKERVLPIALRLSSRGYACHAFDAVGHGESGGSLESSSLFDRSTQATCCLQFLGSSANPILIGVSMGGFTALDLALRVGVATDRLVLLAPAVYADDAYHVPFGPAFSSILRAERSWERSLLWSKLEDYKGNVHVLIGDRDDVIPPQIPIRIVERASRVGQASLTVLPGVPHQVSGLMCEDPLFADRVSDKICESLSTVSGGGGRR
jgi:pimeloyl-ACP methyl ester carboxylesterase